MRAISKKAPGDTGALLDDYYTHEQLAAELGVTTRTLKTWRSLGEAPPITRIGVRIFFARADCEDWLKRQRVEPA